MSRNGHALRLRIVGYQFPDADDPEQRFSWNMVEGDATHGPNPWSFRWPALACHEPPLLASWLRDVAAWAETPPHLRATAPAALSFTEPNLSFQVLDVGANPVTVRVALDHEFRPPTSTGTDPGGPAHLNLHVGPDDLRRAANELDVDIANHPDGLSR